MFKSSLILKVTMTLCLVSADSIVSHTQLVQCHEVLQLTLSMYDKYSLYKDCTDNDNKWVAICDSINV